MKHLTLLLFLAFSISLSSQIVFTEYSKQLLFEPSPSLGNSPALNAYFINEYETLIAELESDLDQDLSLYDEINDDIIKLEDVLELWIEQETTKLIDYYNEEDCIEIQTSEGHLNSDQIVSIKEIDLDSSVLILQKIPVEITKKKGKWVKKKKYEDCVSTNPNDCYVACWEEEGGKTLLLYEDEKIEFATLPINFDYNLEKRRLEREIELFPTIVIITDQDGNEFEVISWEQVDCE